MKHNFCYLCGKAIINDKERNRDHLPPSLFFPKSLRKKYNLDQLIVLQTHKSCNSNYSLDEEYFRDSLSVHASHSFIGKFLWEDISLSYKRPNKKLLGLKIRSEFKSQTPSGIHLPLGQLGQYFDGNRIYRVIWKIVRGIFYFHYKNILPENTSHICKIYDPSQTQPNEFLECWNTAMSLPSAGKYKGIFDYKFTQAEGSSTNMHICCLLFWDSIAFLCIFHDPGCVCEECVKKT